MSDIVGSVSIESWELRAAISLARFTESIVTQDRNDTKVLLDELC